MTVKDECDSIVLLNAVTVLKGINRETGSRVARAAAELLDELLEATQ